jgi:DNA-binding CsgD family transcriptional regulator
MVRGSELDIAVRASIVSLRFGAGLKSVEIASMLNIDPGTVRTTCHRMKRAANSEDLLELLKHCRTKKRSGRPSMKNAAAVGTANANANGNASPSAAEEDDDKDNHQHEHEHEALVSTAASISPDPLAENFETTAWPERDLTAATATDTTNTPHSHPAPEPPQYHNALPSETLPYTTLDPQLSTPQPSDPQHPHQWPPRKTWGEQSSVRTTLSFNLHTLYLRKSKTSS